MKGAETEGRRRLVLHELYMPSCHVGKLCMSFSCQNFSCMYVCGEGLSAGVRGGRERGGQGWRQKRRIRRKGWIKGMV